MFNLFYQAGILLGPLVGLVLVAVDFQVTAAAAAAVFAVLTAAQLLALPQRGVESAPRQSSFLQDWRVIAGNRPFLLFAAAMIGSYVLTFQVYLALPLQASMLTPRSGKALVAALFVISGLVAVLGQLRITRWFTKRWGPGRSLAIGVAILAASFVPLTVIPDGHRFGTPAAVGALLLSAAMLAVGSAAVFPFEMDTVVSPGRGPTRGHPLWVLQHHCRNRNPRRQPGHRIDIRCGTTPERRRTGLGRARSHRHHRRSCPLPSRTRTRPATGSFRAWRLPSGGTGDNRPGPTPAIHTATWQGICVPVSWSSCRTPARDDDDSDPKESPQNGIGTQPGARLLTFGHLDVVTW